MDQVLLVWIDRVKADVMKSRNYIRFDDKEDVVSVGIYIFLVACVKVINASLIFNLLLNFLGINNMNSSNSNTLKHEVRKTTFAHAH